jgi:hypothetical protein
MSLHGNYDQHHVSEYKYDDEVDDLPKRKRIKKLLEDRLERKRLKDEFKDDFDEINGEFDWDELDK